MRQSLILALIALAPFTTRAEDGHRHQPGETCSSAHPKTPAKDADANKPASPPADADGHRHQPGESCESSHAKQEATHAHEDEHQHADGPLVALSEIRRQNLALRTETPAPAKIAATVFALGELTVAPASESAASTRVAGRVLELRVTLGDAVKKGDTLAVIESRQPGGDPVRVPVLALADGTVDRMLTRLGDPVSPDSPLMLLSDHRRMIAQARVPQRHMSRMRRDVTRVRVSPEGGSPLELRWTGAYLPRADADSGVATALFDIDNGDLRLKPGQRAQFRVILSEKEHPVTLPREAVQGENGDFFVFTEEKPGVYRKNPVVVVDGDELRTAVSGLDEDEKVVVHGAASLRYADAASPSLKAAMEAAHGHAHGPNGEEPGEEGDSPAKKETHAEGDGHDDHDEAPAAPPGNSALQAQLDAAHGHAHGPGGEEPAARSGAGSFFSGESGAVLFGTLAAGEAVLLAIALGLLRRKNAKENPDA